MKLLYPIFGLISIIAIGLSALALSNLPTSQDITQSDTKKDKIIIDSVSLSDSGIRCFTTPCTFWNVSFNLTVVNTFEKTIEYPCFNRISMRILPGSNNADQWIFKNEDFNENACKMHSETISSGTWKDNYNIILYLAKMPTSQEQIPNPIDIQLILGNNSIVSPVYSLDLTLTDTLY